METKPKTNKKFTDSITFKGLIIGALVMILLIPQAMIQRLIHERQQRSIEAIAQINEQWSRAQTFCGPILTIPYSDTIGGHISVVQREINISPRMLNIDVKLFPEQRNFGIYRTIVYKSEINISGHFPEFTFPQKENPYITMHWDKARITIDVSDLRGLTDIEFSVNQHKKSVRASEQNLLGQSLTMYIQNIESLKNGESQSFEGRLSLKGSRSMDFIPIGQTTNVRVSGAWTSPGFRGNFSPQREISDNGFTAGWNILHFNRDIPETWRSTQRISFTDSAFGVRLVETVDHYQQNERSAKYAIMFLALTFAVFFFVEVLTGKKIHPIQYLLVGIALILFYSLLLSFSEKVGFEIAYLIASTATVSLITAYTYSIFKNKLQTGIMFLLLCALYTFLFVILRLQDTALLIGSIGLFIILGICMYISRKIDWYKLEKKETQE